MKAASEPIRHSRPVKKDYDKRDYDGSEKDEDTE